jgi:hypothetical protein
MSQLLEKLKISNLQEISKSTKLSRQTLYNFLNGQNTTTDTINKLKTYFQMQIDDQLYTDLKFYGAPLAVKDGRPNLELDQALLNALQASRSDSLLESVLPYVFYKNQEALNLEVLFRESVKLNNDQLLGYYLEMADQFIPVQKFKNFTNLMRQIFVYDLRPLMTISGKPVPDYAISAYMKNTVALSWGLLVRGELKFQIERFKKWGLSENQI